MKNVIGYREEHFSCLLYFRGNYGIRINAAWLFIWKANANYWELVLYHLFSSYFLQERPRLKNNLSQRAAICGIQEDKTEECFKWIVNFLAVSKPRRCKWNEYMKNGTMNVLLIFT